MSTVSILFLLVGLRLFCSACVQIFAAYRVGPERAEFIGGRVFWDHLYSGIFDIAMSLIAVLGALFGTLVLDLDIWIILILLVLFELKCRAVERLALTVAGIVAVPLEQLKKPAEKTRKRVRIKIYKKPL